MVESTSTSVTTNNNSVDPNDPVTLLTSDLSSVSIISFKLLGTSNYKSWASATELALRGRNKLGFVLGTCKKPTDNVNKALLWDRADAIVQSWLLASVSENIYASHVLSKSSFEVWSDLKETYEKLDGSVVYNVYQKINSCTQGSDSLSDYYDKLSALWKEFDSLTNLTSCVCDASKKFSDHSEQIKLMQFLMGLDDSFGHVRSNILLREPLPSVKTAFSICSREESHKIGTSSGGQNSKNSSIGFFSKVNDNSKNDNSKKKQNKNTYVCKHCGLKGHTIDRCFKLVGYPKDFKGKTESQVSNKSFSSTVNPSDLSKSDGLQNSSSGSSFGFTSDQVSKLLSLINEKQRCDEVVANMAGLYENNIFRNSKWVVDSGANQHMTSSELELFSVVDISDLKLKVDHPNGSSAPITKSGNLILSKSVTLFDVLVVPDFNVNLLSVHKVVKDNRIRVAFDETECYFQDLQAKLNAGTGSQVGGLYYVEKGNSGRVVSNFAFIPKCFVSKATWHNRLGHPSEPVLRILGSSLDINDDPLPPCDVCHRAKQTRTPFPLSDHKSNSLGDLIHLDVWGPYKVPTCEGFRFFLTVVDDFTRSVWIFLLKNKSDVFDNFEIFYNLLSNQFDKKVKIVRSDNGTEFVNGKFQKNFKNNGIIHQTTCAYTPQQNGVAERKHRHLLNVARSLLFHSGVPLKYWGDVVLSAAYLVNRTPSSVLKGKSPFELIYGKTPSFEHLRVYGSLCFATKLNLHDKFESRAVKAVFIGYSSFKKGYKLLNLENNTTFFSRDVKFYEHIMPFKMSNDLDESSFNQNRYLSFFDSSLTSDNGKSVSDEDANQTHINGSRVSSPNLSNSTDVVNKSNKPTELELDTTLSSDTTLSVGNDSSTPTHSWSGRTSGLRHGTRYEDLDNMHWESRNDDNLNRNGDVLVAEEPQSKDVGPSVGTNIEPQSVRKSTRQSRVPRSLDDFVLESKYKFGIEKVVNYSHLDSENFCFVSNLNKTIEP